MHHSKSAEEVMVELQTSERGLEEGEAELRLGKYGYNEFGKGKRRSVIQIMLEQFKNFLLVMLAAAAVVAHLIGHNTDALAIGLVVVLNVIFGVALEYSADRSMDELKKLAQTKALVKRGGKKDLLDSKFLVPGDLIYLEEGGKVPADCRIVEENGLEINESSLTGESMPVRKNVGRVAAEAPLAERSCMVFAGTFVARGNARAIVVGTGSRTEFGAVEKSILEVGEEQTTLEKRLEELSKNITMVSFAVVGVLFLAGMVFGKWQVEDLFIYSVSVIVAAVPEGMLTILTLVLAIGVKNMAKENALVRKLQAVETLGNITFIATDKTGTITQGTMALVKIYDGKVRDFAELSGTERVLSYAYLCNSAHLTDDGVVGDETDRALLIAGIAKGVNVRQFRHISKKIAFFPFDYNTKSMSGIYEINGEQVAVVKGAPEAVLEMCSEFEGLGKLDGKRKEEVSSSLEMLAKEGMRIIAVAYAKPKGKEVPQRGLTFAGLLALHDPVRREVRQTMEICRQAGIKVMMITGDNLATAQKVAKEVGLAEGKKVVLWADLEKMDDEALDKTLFEVGVVARATPASKLRIVERLVRNNEIVAVTGDGVNDAPALKKAHVGVVMGRTGTAVSKEVADLVLMDDNFATLEKAVEYGRGITDNIVKFLRFQITTNLALVMLSVPYVLGIRLLEPVHILWINLIIDGPPALTLGLEKPAEEIMKRQPKKKTTFVDLEFIGDALGMAAYMAVASLVLFVYYANTEPFKAETMAFSAFAFMQLFNALNSRSRTERFYSGLWTNKWLPISLAAAAIVQLMLIYASPLEALFTTVPLGVDDIIIMLVVSGSVLVVGEVRKRFARG